MFFFLNINTKFYFLFLLFIKIWWSQKFFLNTYIHMFLSWIASHFHNVTCYIIVEVRTNKFTLVWSCPRPIVIVVQTRASFCAMFCLFRQKNHQFSYRRVPNPSGRSSYLLPKTFHITIVFVSTWKKYSLHFYYCYKL